jgi:CRISPR-associated protein Cas2
MLIVSYDIANDKLRTKFSKYLCKFGYRLQYSVFEIKNSDRILKNIICEVETKFADKFTELDSIIIFDLSKQCKKHSFGYAKHDDDSLIIID